MEAAQILEEEIKMPLDFMRNNLKINLNKMEEVSKLLITASRGVIKPVKKINQTFLREMWEFKNKFEKLKSNLDKKEEDGKLNNMDAEKDSEKNTENEEEKNSQKEITIDQNSAQDTKLNNLLEKSMQIVCLFNNLFKTKEFSELVERFNETMGIDLKKSHSDDNEMIEKEINIFNDMFNDKEDSDAESQTKTKNKKFIGKKTKRSDSESKVPKKDETSAPKKIKQKPENSIDLENEDDNKGRRMNDEECTEKMKEIFGNDYKGVTKTFLTRKLTRKIIWTNDYDFSQVNPFKTQREIIKSATYKFAKIVWKLEENKNNILDLIQSVFKKYVWTKSGKSVTVGGELHDDLEEFVEKFKNNELIKTYSLDKMKIEVYNFMEELYLDFNDSDEKTFTNDEAQAMRKDNSTLQKMRDQWKKLKTIKV